MIALLRNRFVQIALAIWISASAAIPLLAHGRIPFDQTMLASLSHRGGTIGLMLSPVFDFVVIAVAWLLTRKRTIPDVAARAPARALALGETLGLLTYGVIVLAGGYLVGRLFGTHTIGLHLTGSMFGLNTNVAPREAYLWAVYNFVFYAAIPYVVFRRRGYSTNDLCLHSSNVASDTLVIFAVLALACLGGIPIVSLPAHEIVLAGLLAFVFSLFGTGFPIMIFLCSILVPRYRRLTGSTAGAVVLTGFTYAALHLTEYWNRYDSVAHGLLSVIFIVLLYSGPGFVKGYLTLRTGNAWVHLWGWHAIAPHVTVDAPTFARIFRL